MKITWLPPVMKKYQAWKKYPTDIELWFAWTLTLKFWFWYITLHAFSLEEKKLSIQPLVCNTLP